MLTIIGDLLSESAAPPQLRASLYQVATTSVLLAKEETPAQLVAVDGTPVPPRIVTDYTLYLQSDIVSSDNATAGGS